MKHSLHFFLFQVYNSRLFWNLRRVFRPEPSPYELAAFRLQETFNVLPKTRGIRKLPNGPILVPSYRMDGIGIQVIIRVAVQYLAMESGATYVHYPFIEIEHQDADPQGSKVSKKVWSQQWETFFNLGKDQYSVKDWAQEIGPFRLAHLLTYQALSYLDPKGEGKKDLPIHLNNIRTQQPGAYIFSLGLLRQTEACNFKFNAEFIQKMQHLLKQTAFSPQRNLFQKPGIHIAIHIRRGDVWQNIQSGNTAKRFMDRLLDENFYVRLLQQLHEQWQDPSLIHYHVFSDGSFDDFQHFEFDEHKALLRDQPEIENIQFHLEMNAMDTLYHLINAPILFPAKSTFSLLGIIFGTGKIILHKEVLQYSHYAVLSQYMEESPNRFIQFDDFNPAMIKT